jgi:hypothetical protein
MTNAERRERRREAARKAAETRRARLAARPEPDRTETPEEADRRAEDREARRRANLRAVLAEARRIRREGDLYYHAHQQRWSQLPAPDRPSRNSVAHRPRTGR